MWREKSTSKRTIRYWLKKSCLDNLSLEDEEVHGRLSRIDNDQLSLIIEVDSRKATREIL